MTLLWTLCRVRLGAIEDRHNKSEGFTLDVLFYWMYTQHIPVTVCNKTVSDIPVVYTLFCQSYQRNLLIKLE